MHGNKFTEVLVPYTKGSGSHQKTSEELKNQEIYLPHLLSVNQEQKYTDVKHKISSEVMTKLQKAKK